MTDGSSFENANTPTLCSRCNEWSVVWARFTDSELNQPVCMWCDCTMISRLFVHVSFIDWVISWRRSSEVRGVSTRWKLCKKCGRASVVYVTNLSMDSTLPLYRCAWCSWALITIIGDESDIRRVREYRRRTLGPMILEKPNLKLFKAFFRRNVKSTG